MPITALAVVSYVHVTTQLEEQGRTRLREASKFEGLAILDRLSFVESELKAVVAELAAPRTGPREGMTAVAGQRGIRSIRIDPGAQPEEDLAHLGAGGSLLRGSRSGIRLGRAADPSHLAAGVVWAEIDPGYLWRAESAGLCVVTAGSLPFHCDFADPSGLATMLNARSGAESTGQLEWHDGGQVHIVGYWSLFLHQRFRAGNWVIAVGEPIPRVLAPVARFRRTFPAVAALALATVLLLSSVEIRRRFQPIRDLHDATVAIGEGNLDHTVDITSGDELEILGTSFNAMVSRIKGQLHESQRLNTALVDAGHLLRENEERLRTIVESASHAIVTTRPNGIIEGANEAAVRLFGRRLGELVGSSFAGLLGDGEPMTQTDLRSLIGRTVERAARRADGTALFLEVALSEARIGAEVLYTAFIQDLTERKAAEAERLSLQDQLSHAQKMETIGALAGGIAHDFNNILTPIHGYLTMALEDVDEASETHDDLREVKQAATRAQHLVRQILTFSRPTETKFESTRLEPVVKEALTLLRASIPSSIAFDVGVDDTCPAVLADSTQMHQVTMNLCTNAYHAMQHDPKGVLTVRLETVEVPLAGSGPEPTVPPGSYVRLAVTDTGHGMDDETRARLFEPFFTTKEAGAGTGLGLSVVHRIARSHGGDIAVLSSPGQGSTFALYVPVATDDAVQEPGDEQVAQRGNGRLLVADDELAIGRMISRMMDRLGYETTVVSDGTEALECFRVEPERYDLVLTDYMMPGLNGVELAKAVTVLRPGVPVILISGHLRQFEGMDLEGMGVSSFHQKPIDLFALAGVIRRQVEDARMAQRGPRGNPFQLVAP